MGWFLHKKKKSRYTRKRKVTDRQPWDPERTLIGLKYLLVVMVAVGVLIGWSRAERYLAAYTSRNTHIEVTAEHVELIDPPSWMNTVLGDELRRLVATQIAPNPFDNHSLQQAAFVLSTNPWVDRVERVQRAGHNRVAVYAVYRHPVAIIESRDGYHLVDVRGTRLPGLYLEHQIEQLTLPLIIGVAAAPRLEGEVWPGDDLQAGLSLVNLLGDQPYFDQIQACDVSVRDERGRINLTLTANTGGRVRWGLPPGRERSIEPDALTKKYRLASVYAQRGSIDAGGKIVDLSGPAVFVQNPAYPVPGLQTGYTWSR